MPMVSRDSPPPPPESVISRDNIYYRWGVIVGTLGLSPICTLGMIYLPSTALRFHKISPSDRPLPPRALHHSCRHLNRGRTAPVHPLRITYIYVTERDVRNWRQIVQQQRRGLPLEKHHYLAQLHTAPRSITLYLSTPRPTKMRFAWSVRLS